MSDVFDRAAATYGSIGPDFFSHFGQQLVDSLGIEDGERVLDVACGTGAALVPAAEGVGPAGLAVGVDLSEVMLRRTFHALARAGQPRRCVARMDAQRLGFRAASFDAVVSSFALGSFPAPLRALEECRRIVRAGGRLGLVVADRWWWEGDEHWAWHAALLESLGVVVEQGRFTAPEAVIEVLERADWTVTGIHPERFPLAFFGVEEWWRWAWSHGYRQILERMSAGQLESYRGECFRQLRKHQPPIGGQLEVLVATAIPSRA